MVIVLCNFLSAELCDNIIQAAKEKGLSKATVLNSDGSSYLDENHRGGYTTFIPSEQMYEICGEFRTMLNNINQTYFKANITSYGFQVAEYREHEAGFGWHHDDPMYSYSNVICNGRKLTLVFQLSNENTYQGGVLEINPYGKYKEPIKASNIQGTCIAFPSFFMHRVTPITSGTRYSLTVWGKGPTWM